MSTKLEPRQQTNSASQFRKAKPAKRSAGQSPIRVPRGDLLSQHTRQNCRPYRTDSCTDGARSLGAVETGRPFRGADRQLDRHKGIARGRGETGEQVRKGKNYYFARSRFLSRAPKWNAGKRGKGWPAGSQSLSSRHETNQRPN